MRLQLWPALVEKAYAKAHGCYAHLSGGFIAEGLQGLTGAPMETILLNEYSGVRQDALWERLTTLHQQGCLMGLTDFFRVQGKSPNDEEESTGRIQRKLVGEERCNVRA